jgi:hypothetical protein
LPSFPNTPAFRPSSDFSQRNAIDIQSRTETVLGRNRSNPQKVTLGGWIGIAVGCLIVIVLFVFVLIRLTSAAETISNSGNETSFQDLNLTMQSPLTIENTNWTLDVFKMDSDETL